MRSGTQGKPPERWWKPRRSRVLWNGAGEKFGSSAGWVSSGAAIFRRRLLSGSKSPLLAKDARNGAPGASDLQPSFARPVRVWDPDRQEQLPTCPLRWERNVQIGDMALTIGGWCAA